MIIDIHAHYPEGDSAFPEKLVAALPQAGIDKICLFSAGKLLGHVSNEVILAAAKKHPEIIPFALIELGTDAPEAVDRCVAQGFRGFKITNPRSSYDDPAYFPLYERMERSGLPLLAHTGLLKVFQPPKGMIVNSRWMMPGALDAVCRTFPKLNIIGAHLGAPWHEEASMMARLHPNYYVDLTGAYWGGWRVNKNADFYRYHFFWKDAWDKVLFGTDILALDELMPAKEVHDQIMKELALPQDIVDRVYGGTAMRLLGMRT